MRAFFECWYPRLVRFIYVRVGDADQAEDLAQEAFLRLLQNAPRHPKAWLFTVAENLLRDEARLASGRARHLTLIQAAREEERDPGPESELLRKDDAALVRRALERLPERDRTLLLLHHEGFRYREIAEHLGLAPASIGSLLTRAQRRFLESFNAACGNDERRASA